MALQIMKKCIVVKYYEFICCVVIASRVASFEENNEDIGYILTQLDRFNYEYRQMWWMRQNAEWHYSTNVTLESKAELEYITEIFSDFMKKWIVWARRINNKDFPSFMKDPLNRMASGIFFMNKGEARAISDLRSKMVEIYSSANISLPKLGVKAQGEAEYSSLMGKFRDPDILNQLWKSWRIQVGERMRPLFLNLVQLTNKAAQENGYENIGSTWRQELGSNNILEDALLLWEEVKNFYAHLHAYVRHKLRQVYGGEHFTENGLIPAHLLGSLWGDNWVALNDILVPYPDQPSLNMTAIFYSKSYSVYDLIKKAEEFYITAGLSPMTQSFWKKSMFIKPKDGRVVDCHPASYDFALNCDYRVRMCGEVKEQSFLEFVHEMGHIQYYMAYRKLPMIYRNGANSAFHEAIGETMVYSVQSPECLHSLNIVQSSEISKETFINNLMKQALSKIVLLPWALTIETWRYSVLEGDTKEEDMDENWWKLRESFQGIEPPDEESRKLFDAGTKYHIINNIPYMRYFIGRFLEHQFLESLCEIQKENVHSCCFMKDKNVGKRLKEMLELGSSVSWQDALETLTGKRKLSAYPLMKYYKPLYLWLVQYNVHHNIRIVL